MLPRLRTSLDFLPSPVPDRPGLVIRDPFQYSDATLIIPPGLVACLEFFDGEHSSLDLRAYLVRATGELEVGEIEQHLLDTLSAAGFLEDEAFARRKEAAERAFAEAPIREPSHAGSGYPEEKSELIRTFDEYLAGDPPATVRCQTSRHRRAPCKPLRRRRSVPRRVHRSLALRCGAHLRHSRHLPLR